MSSGTKNHVLGASGRALYGKEGVDMADFHTHTEYLTAIISALLLSTPVGGSVSYCPCLTDFIIISTITVIRNTYREISIIIIKLA